MVHILLTQTGAASNLGALSLVLAAAQELPLTGGLIGRPHLPRRGWEGRGVACSARGEGRCLQGISRVGSDHGMPFGSFWRWAGLHSFTPGPASAVDRGWDWF